MKFKVLMEMSSCIRGVILYILQTYQMLYCPTNAQKL